MKESARGVLWMSGLMAFARANTSMQMINSAAAYKCPFTSVTTRAAAFSRLSSPSNREFNPLLFADCEVTFSRLGIFFDKNPGPIVMFAAPFALSQILNLFEFLLGIVENPVRCD